jgi:5-methyltetrahydrofolate--homocysteine methyltransferase
MGLLMDRLGERGLLVSDGAWGTMLQAQGLEAGSCTEEWNLSHPDEVRAVARAYSEAGAELVLSNTFGGSRIKLARHGLADKVADVNAAGARLSIEGAGDALVAASVGPTGEFMEPLGEMTAAEMEAVFAEQISALVSGGARAVCIETMTALEESLCAVRAARSVDAELDIVATMTFDPVAGGEFRTMMGVSPQRAAQELSAAGADVIGANCGNGIAAMVAVARAMREATDRPILVHANAGVPELVDGQTVFKETPTDMAGRVEELVEAGARIVGGCCGTTPEHIRAIRAVVERLRS